MWAKTPHSVVAQIYESGYEGSNPEIMKFSQMMKDLKDEGYATPLVSSWFEDGIWISIVDLYLYADEDGSVLDHCRIDIHFKSKRVLQHFFRPEISEVIYIEAIVYDN
ncbi:hypothetical protein F3D3_0549 [Fusibacter sp. 3D3]|nr:hypothetical protein F3D3_0549 [Fusibacter sp. 3D3]